MLVRVSGYGQTGPYSSRAGYGSIGEAMGGLRYITGDPDRQPSRTGISIGDALAAMHATIGALAALRHRDVTGEGQVVDSAIYEAVLAMMESTVTEWDVQGYQRERTGAVLPNVAPSNVYPTADGQLILIAANQDSVFGRLVTLMDEAELAEPGSRYADHSGRGEHQQELDDHIAVWTSKYDADDLLALLHEGGVPAGRIFKAVDMLTDPHFAAREAIVRVADPKFGELAMQNVVPKLSATPGKVRWTGPTLGPAQRRGVRRPARPQRRAARRAPGRGHHLMEPRATTGRFGGRIGFGARPAVVVVDVVTAYLERRPADRRGRALRERARQHGAGGRGRPGRRPSGRLHDRQARRRRRRRRLVRGQGAGAERLRGRLAVRRVRRRSRPASGRGRGHQAVRLVVLRHQPRRDPDARPASTPWSSTGFSTSGCVRATALDALQHGFRPIVAAEACGDRDVATHEQNLFDLDSKYADVLSEDDVVAHLTAHPHR